MDHRKTGITLEDTGERDEYGMEPVDNLFSSPEKSRRNYTNDSEDEQDMEIDEGMRAPREQTQN